jgi:hypothetical protein
MMQQWIISANKIIKYIDINPPLELHMMQQWIISAN